MPQSFPPVTNVAHIAFSLRTGGMERLLVDFARHADRDSFRLHVFSLTAQGPLAAEIESAGCPVTALDKRPGFRPSLVTRLAGEFRRRRIQVCHTHNTGAMIYGALAARLAGVPCVVHTRHGQRFGSGRRQSLQFALLSRLTDRVVGVSQDCSALSIREGVPSRLSQTIRNGINLDRFALHGPDPTGPAMTVARLAPEKDLETLIRATQVVVRKHAAFRLQIVGDGPCRESLTRLIDSLGLANHVTLLGERQDVPELLRTASMFVLPSKSEGISLTLLEAMATGLPTIASAVGGNVEVVQDRRTGMLFDVGKVHELARNMQLVYDDPRFARRLGRAGRERVCQHFEITQMVRTYERTYTEILARKAGHARRRLLQPAA